MYFVIILFCGSLQSYSVYAMALGLHALAVVCSSQRTVVLFQATNNNNYLCCLL